MRRNKGKNFLVALLYFLVMNELLVLLAFLLFEYVLMVVLFWFVIGVNVQTGEEVAVKLV